MGFDIKTLGLWFVIWLVGYGLGLLEAKIKNNSKDRREEAKLSPIIDTEVNKEFPQSSPPSSPYETEILTVFERISGALKVRIDGETVEYKSDLDVEKRARLLNIVIAMRPWLEKSATEKSTSVAPVTSAPPKEVSPPTPLPTTLPPTPTEPAPNPELVIDTRLEEITTSKLTMVEQIDRILQKKLDSSPLKAQGIHLRTALSGGLLIKIGLREYEWIDDIPEQPIQEVIRASIAEWEKNATPG